MLIFFRVLSVLYIAGIFLLADSPMVSDVATFNPYSLLHIPLYGILTFLLILSFPPKGKGSFGVTGVTNSTDPRDSIDPTNPSNPSNPITLLLAGSIALAVAIADEIHQAYLPNRDASVFDVFLDAVGIILCVVLIYKGRKQIKVDNLVKSRHSRENGNPGNSNDLKILDSCLRRNDKNLFFRLFTRPSRFINVIMLISRKTQKKVYD
jgi:hypothetical protein